MRITLKSAAWLCVTLACVASGRAASPATAPAKEIPLNTIYATLKQPELKTVETGPTIEPAKTPAVSAFAWAKDFQAITQKNLISAVGTAKAPQVLKAPAGAEGSLWVVTSLGSGSSSPPQIIIKSVTWTKERQVTVVFEKAPPGPATMDLKPYVAWIPLGKVSPGDYASLLETGGKPVAEQKWTVVETGKVVAATTLPSGGTEVQNDDAPIIVKVPQPEDVPHGRGR